MFSYRGKNTIVYRGVSHNRPKRKISYSLARSTCKPTSRDIVYQFLRAWCVTKFSYPLPESRIDEFKNRKVRATIDKRVYWLRNSKEKNRYRGATLTQERKDDQRLRVVGHTVTNRPLLRKRIDRSSNRPITLFLPRMYSSTISVPLPRTRIEINVKTVRGMAHSSKRGIRSSGHASNPESIPDQKSVLSWYGETNVYVCVCIYIIYIYIYVQVCVFMYVCISVSDAVFDSSTMQRGEWRISDAS